MYLKKERFLYEDLQTRSFHRFNLKANLRWKTSIFDLFDLFSRRQTRDVNQNGILEWCIWCNWVVCSNSVFILWFSKTLPRKLSFVCSYRNELIFMLFDWLLSWQLVGLAFLCKVSMKNRYAILKSFFLDVLCVQQ